MALAISANIAEANIQAEKQVFKLSFRGSRAGEGILETLANTVIQNKPALHFRATVQTIEFIGMIYPYKQVIDIYLDQTKFTPIFVDVNINDRKKVQHTIITLDQTKLAGEEIENSAIPDQPPSHRRKNWKINLGAQSLYSIFPFLRFQPLAIGSNVRFPVAHDEKNAEFSADILKTEKIHVAGVEREALVMKVNRSFTSAFYPNLKEEPLVWVSNDAQKKLLKFEIQHKAGKVQALLSK